MLILVCDAKILIKKCYVLNVQFERSKYKIVLNVAPKVQNWQRYLASYRMPK